MRNKALMAFHASLLTALALLASSQTLQHVVKPITNVLAGGVSNFKVFLFFAYPLLVTLPWYKDWELPVGSKRVLVVSTVLVFLSGLLQLALLASDPGVPVDKRAIYFNAGDYSSNSLIHMHNTKTTLSLAPSLFSEELMYSYDAGVPYHAFLPTWAITLHTVLFGIATASLILVGVTFKTKGRTKKILYIILSYCLFKNMIDGGLFNTQALSSMLGLIPLLRDRLTYSRFFSWVTVGLGITVAISFILDLQYTTPASTSIVFLMFLLTAYSAGEGRWSLTAVFGVVLTILAYTSVMPPPPTQLHTYTADLEPNTTFALLSVNANITSDVPAQIVESHTVVHGTHHTLRTTHQTSVAGLVSRIGGTTSAANIQVAGKNCETNKTDRRYLKLATAPPPTESETQHVTLSLGKKRFTTSMRDCIAAKGLHRVKALHEAGLQRGAWYIPDELTPLEPS